MDVSALNVTRKAVIGQRIRQARMAKGWTLERLADALNISKVSIWQWEQGQSRPKVSRLAEVAQLLGLPLQALMDEHAPARMVNREASNLLLECQMRIAESFGVRPADVEIKVSFGRNA
jgi:transcriptional regulator with XRE-family HTH domain